MTLIEFIMALDEYKTLHFMLNNDRDFSIISRSDLEDKLTCLERDINYYIKTEAKIYPDEE